MKDTFITDANVLFSCIISGKEQYQQIFADYKFFLPDYALTEIQHYQQLIKEKTKLSPEALKTFTLSLFDKVVVVPNFLISTNSYFKAFELCKDIDEKDTPYLALSIELDMKLLSKDVELITGLRAKGYHKLLTLSEFFEGLSD